MTDEGPRDRPTILIVDDEPTNVHLASDVLRPHYRIVIATNGRRALHVARAQRPDLVLLDVHLPDQHGYDVCRQLKDDEATRHAAVLFLTASDDPAREDERRAAGAAETLTKPIDPATLLERVAAHLHRPA